jgi:hypothetical protein
MLEEYAASIFRIRVKILSNFDGRMTRNIVSQSTW